MTGGHGVAVALALALGLSAPAVSQAARAIFATGCFWSAESDFESLPGVSKVTAGYTGGYASNPTYEQVGSGLTGHAEAIEVIYDPLRISYAKLLAHFWHTHDPFDGDGQFCDQGTPYRPAIFWLDDAQKTAAQESLAVMQKRFHQPVLTHISQGERFWPAEALHQDFARLHPERYAQYRAACGRDARLRKVWGRESGE